jgi:hypothetical protein
MQKRKQISLRVQPDILEWFKGEQPKGYQTLMHSVLENHVRTETERRIRIAGRAQEIYRQYYSQCFWHYRPDLKISPDNTHLVVNGLRKYGGVEGAKLAEELCQ